MPEQLSHAQLWKMREDAKNDPQKFAALAPAEHGAFAREWTTENPMLAAPSLAVAAPLYYAAKNPLFMGLAQKAGLVGEGATPASVDQLIASYRGIWEGLQQASKQTLRDGKGKGV